MQLGENDKFCWFLCNFREYIRAEFLSYHIMEKSNDESKRDIILEHALKNEENLKIVLDIVSVGPELEVRRQIAKPFQMEISERDIMLNHILENEKDLEIARDIISTSQELRKLIIETFLAKLECFIRSERDMSQWNFKVDSPFRLKTRDIYVFEVTKIAWQEQYSVVLVSSYQARWVNIGLVGKNTGEGIKRREDVKRIIEYLNQKLNEDFLLEEREKKCWIFEKDLKSSMGWNYGQWTVPEKQDKPHDQNHWKVTDTFIKMYTGEAVEDVGNYLLEIINVAEPVIDEWVKENPLNG